MKISIIIPTYNNLKFLKFCLSSIKRNSYYDHEIILHVNDGSDGTAKFAKENKLIHTHSINNIGLCSSLNKAFSLVSTKFILYSHDDMFFCKNWDIYLIKEARKYKNNLYYLTGTNISKKNGLINYDCGTTLNNFNEKKFNNFCKIDKSKDLQGSHWAPHLVHKKIWNKIGGFSEEFNPGMGSDPDLNMKLWQEGVRIFKGLSKFNVYHFSSITLRKKKNLLINNGTRTFLKKWKITPGFFVKHYLRGGKFQDNKIISIEYSGPIDEPIKNFNYYKDLIKCKIKLIFSYFQ